jgi:hypothetical protein
VFQRHISRRPADGITSEHEPDDAEGAVAAPLPIRRL